MRVNMSIWSNGCLGEELCCSEMMQLFVIVLAMNEISNYLIFKGEML